MHARRMTVLSGLASVAILLPTFGALPSVDDDDPAPVEVDPDEVRSIWEYLSKKYDADEDGEISREEYPRSDERFAKLDVDEDGVVTASDIEARKRARGGGRDDDEERRPDPPEEGDKAPDFTLEVLERAPEEAKEPKRGDRDDDAEEGDEDEEPRLVVQLSDFAKKDKPVALIFGSYT